MSNSLIYRPPTPPGPPTCAGDAAGRPRSEPDPSGLVVTATRHRGQGLGETFSRGFLSIGWMGGWPGK